MNIEKLHSVYFIGIGGIGMSALARYFHFLGKNVAGYDRTETELTKTLEKEGIAIHYKDSIDLIPGNVQNGVDGEVLIVYTPAIPDSNAQLNHLKRLYRKIFKRSEILGLISRHKKSIAVAGTHGKTTVSTQIAHIFKQSSFDCNAFLGGISNNYNTNFLFSANSNYMVLEADEYDRSFLQLFPEVALVTSVEPDHLDIYGAFESLKQNFKDFLAQVSEEGIILIKKEVDIYIPLKAGQHKYTYNITGPADFYAENIRLVEHQYHIDLVTPDGAFPDVKIGFPGYINVENAIAAAAASFLSGIDEKAVRKAIASYQGVKRRFDHKILSDEIIYIDDYAHHPTELTACINSVKKMYPGKSITGIFQPHLYSRTRDFANEFAKSLDALDQIIVVDLYPAREEPINNVSSKIIYDKIENRNKQLCAKNKIVECLENIDFDIVLTLGAGDIDKEVEPIKNYLLKRYKK